MNLLQNQTAMIMSPFYLM